MRRLTVLGVLAALLAPACGSSYMRDATATPALDTRHAKVVFYRPSGEFDYSRFPVYDDDDVVGFTEPACWFEYVCAPGRRAFFLVSNHGTEAVVDAELAPALTYYVKVTLAADENLISTGTMDPIARDSKEAGQLPELLEGLRHRELLPERAGKFAAGKKGRTQQWYVADAKRKLDLGKLVAKKLNAADGR